jgi:membrane protein
VLFAVGLAGALLSASGYVGAFTRASNVVYDTREDRPAWKLRPLQLLLTLVIVLLAAATGIALVLTGPVVDAVAGPLGIGSTATTVWGIAKWPAMLVFLLVVVALLYYVTPNCRRLGFRWLSAGGVVAIALWLLASAVFAFYVSHFGSYDKTYGTLGGVVVLLVWLWIGNVALLFGHQLNAVRERNSFPPPPQG